MKKAVFIFLTAVSLSLLSFTCAMAENPRVLLSTNFGDIVVELNKEKAPVTVKNFMNYADSGFYNRTVFHRVIKGFMIQGGGFSVGLSRKKTDAPIKNEADNGLSNERYTIAMARTSDPHSASSQFFINTSDNYNLNHTGKNLRGWGYCVFGKVVKGFDVVDKIESQYTVPKGMHRNVPAFSIIIKKAEIL